MALPDLPKVLKPEDFPEPPYAIDPETGMPEKIGKGRIVVMKRGEAAIEELVQLGEPYRDPVSGQSDELDNVVAADKLQYNI